MRVMLVSLAAAVTLAAAGCASQNANEAANTATRQVSNAANTIANKTSEVAQNLNKAAGPAVSDATVTARVKAKLLADGITGTTVDTTDGVVTLAGSVTGDEQKAKAERDARETEGVKNVKNELIVKKP
jgi:hyperosmotically inducible periplasmic protein